MSAPTIVASETEANKHEWPRAPTRTVQVLLTSKEAVGKPSGAPRECEMSTHDVKVAEIATTHAVLLAIVENLARNE
jgi:hypothetical protein